MGVRTGKILSVILTIMMIAGTMSQAAGGAFALPEADMSHNAEVSEKRTDKDSDNAAEAETEENTRSEHEESLNEKPEKGEPRAASDGASEADEVTGGSDADIPDEPVTEPAVKRASENTASKAAPSGTAKLSGSATSYLSLVNSTFIFFKTDNIVLETSDDNFDYRVIVDNVECPAGGSYQWDGTEFSEDDDKEFTITESDTHKKYTVSYQAQYYDPDDEQWKNIDGVNRKTEIIVQGDTDKKYVSGDEAYIERINLNMVASGTPDFDGDNEPGNDMDDKNDIVRSFDTVKYNVNYNTRVVDEYDTFSHGYLWVEITLPCTKDIATIDSTVFSPDVKQAKEPYEIETGGETHTVYTFYYEKRTTVEDDGTVNHALPQIGHFPFSMKVFGAKNGTHIKPVVGMAVAQLELDENGDAKTDSSGNYIVARDYSDFEAAYDTPKYAEGPDVMVSAKPGFNVNLNQMMQQNTSRIYDFSEGNDDALDKEAGRVLGRAARFGINVSMMNTDTVKGLKGLELPDGSDITFDLDMEAAFGGDAADPPLIWAVSNNGERSQYGRSSSGSYSTVTRVPKDAHKGNDVEFTERTGNSIYMWNGGDWTLERLGNGKIRVTISNYIVNPMWFPTGYNTSSSSSNKYFLSGNNLKYGVFSARNIDVVIPFGSNITDADGNPRSDGTRPEYATSSDDPKYYTNLYEHDGFLDIKISDSGLDVTSQTGQKTLELYSDQEGQTLYSKADDTLTAGVLLERGAGLDSRRVWFGKNNSTIARDVNGLDYAFRNGKDAVMPGRLIRISGNVTYTHRDSYETSWFGAGQVLIKFDDEHLSPTSGPGEGTFFAAKPDGNGWESDDEMKRTGIDQLTYYDSIEALQGSGKVCVGVLKEFRDTGEPKAGNQGFYLHINDLLVTTDSRYYNTVSMTSMCNRLWKRNAYEKIKELNGEFPSYADPGMQGKTVEEYIADKYGLSDEEKSALSPARDDLNSKSNLEYVKASYDEDGFHRGSGTEPSWGDSLYIIPYKMGIRKYVEQKNGPNSTDSVGYSFENRETVADFCLSPYFTMPDSNTDIEISGAATTVTVSDVLPNGLTYVFGSAYVGGTYENNTPNRGCRGHVEGGEQIEPVIEQNDDGSTVLKWVLEDVVIGDNDALPDIHFSADIDQEIEEHTNWINTGRVRSTEDNREYSSNNNNLDTAKINAAPAANFITKKVAESLFNDQNNEVTWTLRWKNTTNQIYTNRVLMDIMPYNGDPRGTKFSGSYRITDLKYSFLNDLNPSDFRFYYTTDVEARAGLEEELSYSGFTGDNPTVGGISWHKAEIAADGTVSAVAGEEDVAAFLVLGDVKSKGEVRATVTIKPEDNKPGDRYVNAIVANEMIQGSGVHIVKRGLRGNVWRESADSVDGCRQAGEMKLGDVKVVLRKKNSEGEWEEFASTATDKSGRYEFNDLPSGLFKVEFVNSGGRTLSNYRATTQNAADVEASRNSDAGPLYEDEVFAEIDNIEMPAAENMNTSPYYVEYQDLGVWRPDLTVSKTVDASADENEAKIKRDFLFRLTVPGGADNENFEMFDADGESAGQVTGDELGKGYVFRLRHNESICFSELPANVDYTLEEFDYEASGYGYSMSLADGSDEMSAVLDQNRDVKVINTYVPETTKLNISKEWDEDLAETSSDYVRPESIRATLIKDGVATEEHRVLNADNDWSGSFEDLAKYYRDQWPESFDAEPAKEISYLVEETLVGDESYVEIESERRFYFCNKDESIIGYFVSTADDGSIVNRFVAAGEEESGRAEFYVRKVDDKGNVITGSPAVFELFKESGNEVILAETSTESGLAKFIVEDAGTYTLKEKQAPYGYKKTSDTYTINVENTGRVLIEADQNNNKNIFEKLFNISGDGEWDEDTLTLTVANEKLGGTLAISKQVNKNTAHKGDILEYTLLVTNTGEGAVENGKVWDVLPEQLAYESDDSDGVYGVEDGRERIDWSFDRLEPGDTRAIHMLTLVKECTDNKDIVNTAYVQHEHETVIAEDDTTTKVLGKYKDDTAPIKTSDADNISGGVKTGDANSALLTAIVFAASLVTLASLLRRRSKKSR